MSLKDEDFLLPNGEVSTNDMSASDEICATEAKKKPCSNPPTGIFTRRGKPLKGEYKRTQFIRKIKQICRCFADKKLSKKLQTFLNSTQRRDKWLLQELERIYQENRALFDALKDTTSGPATDGKCRRRRNKLAPAKAKSFNKPFCKDFYQHESVRKFHAVLVELVYGRVGEVDPSVLCSKFNETCCRGPQHSVDCLVKWTNVMEFMRTDMLEDLGLEPITCPAESAVFSEFGDEALSSLSEAACLSSDAALEDYPEYEDLIKSVVRY